MALTPFPLSYFISPLNRSSLYSLNTSPTTSLPNLAHLSQFTFLTNPSPPSLPPGTTITKQDLQLRQLSRAHEATKVLLAQLIDEQQQEPQPEQYEHQQDPRTGEAHVHRLHPDDAEWSCCRILPCVRRVNGPRTASQCVVTHRYFGANLKCSQILTPLSLIPA